MSWQDSTKDRLVVKDACFSWRIEKRETKIEKDGRPSRARERERERDREIERESHALIQITKSGRVKGLPVAFRYQKPEEREN